MLNFNFFCLIGLQETRQHPHGPVQGDVGGRRGAGGSAATAAVGGPRQTENDTVGRGPRRRPRRRPGRARVIGSRPGSEIEAAADAGVAGYLKCGTLLFKPVYL